MREHGKQGFRVNKLRLEFDRVILTTFLLRSKGGKR